MLTSAFSVVKMNSLSYLSILQFDYFLETYVTCILKNVTINILKISWKISIQVDQILFQGDDSSLTLQPAVEVVDCVWSKKHRPDSVNIEANHWKSLI